ncbi:MAG: isopentenyl-diphosphate Delta-isomerase [Pseudomonadota bacterium]
MTAKTATKADIVSSESDSLILVDANDQEIGALSKAACHDGDGVLHRAFSAFIFNARGELLLQQRAAEKRLWGGYWSNSCCSHPRVGEMIETAVVRRVQEELGLTISPHFAYRFQYQARFGDLGSEHELCSVFLGHCGDQEPTINTTEVDGWEWIDPVQLSSELAQSNRRFTPWFLLEWQRLTTDFADHLKPANS